jgi:tetratricopeptide (TPR) repeat protein
MGEALHKAGKWHEGLTALEEALLLNRRSLGPKHIRTVLNLNSLCHAYQFVGELQRAEAACAEGLVIERELYPALVGQTLLGVSLLRRRQERFDEALEAGEESLRESLAARGEATTEAAVAYENVAALHLRAGHFVRAIPLFRKARFIYEGVLGPTNSLLASVISQEGLALLEDGQLRQAEINMSHSISLLAGTGPVDEFRRAVAEANLGLLRLRQKRFAESEQLLTHALTVQGRMPAAPTHNLAATMRALAQLRKVQHRDTESAELLARAATIESAR